MAAETGLPGEKPQDTSNFLTCPAWDSNTGSGERQLAVSGNDLDRTAIRPGPTEEMVQ